MLYTFRDVRLPDRRTVRAALALVYGVGYVKSNYLCDILGFSDNLKVSSLNKYQFELICFLMKKHYGVETFLKRAKYNRLKEFLDIKSYKSIKYAAGLPIRGQKTHNNAQTPKKIRYNKIKLKN
jgi:small subunit ribosomal protein S13